jgi:uncharacterized protein involved in type VI secretion and phage assembly
MIAFYTTCGHRIWYERKAQSVRYSGQQLQYLGKSVEDNSQISPETRQVIDGEVQRLVTEQYQSAQALLKDHHEALKTLAQQQGFVARIEPGTMFELEQSPIAEGIWMPSHFSMEAKARVFLLFTHYEHDDATYFSYHKRDNNPAERHTAK